MNVYWDFKVIAEEESQALTILAELTKALDLNVKSHEIQEYPKFSTRLFSLTVHSLMDGRVTTIDDVQKLFNQLGTSLFVDKYEQDGREYIEAMFDSRKHLAKFPAVFWAIVNTDKRVKSMTGNSEPSV